MEVRTAASPEDVKYYTTERLRKEFLIQDLFVSGEIRMVYSHIDRVITGGIVPVTPLSLTAGEELRADFFLQRREMGIINIGAEGMITVDGKKFPLRNRDGLYIGMGSRNISFASKEQENPARFYMISTPAHRTFPTVLIKPEGEEGDEERDAIVIVKPENKVELGTMEESNQRTICKYILPGQVESCQLVMGMTALEPGSVWNSMPCHTHDRRMEVYLYFDLPEDAFVMHYMGEPSETRHIVMRNEEAVLSPSWSVHCGCGSRAYTFIWAMAGENQAFDDMDGIDNRDLL